MVIGNDIIRLILRWQENIGKDGKTTPLDTFEYWSPEMMECNGKYNHKSNDFWALGVFIYELILHDTPNRLTP